MALTGSARWLQLPGPACCQAPTRRATLRQGFRGDGHERFLPVLLGPSSVPAALLVLTETAPDHVGLCREAYGQNAGHEEECTELVHGLSSFGYGPPAAGSALGTVLFGQSGGLHPLHRKPGMVSYRFLRVDGHAWWSEARQGLRRRLPVTGRRRMLAGS